MASCGIARDADALFVERGQSVLRERQIASGRLLEPLRGRVRILGDAAAIEEAQRQFELGAGIASRRRLAQRRRQAGGNRRHQVRGGGCWRWPASAARRSNRPDWDRSLARRLRRRARRAWEYRGWRSFLAPAFAAVPTFASRPDDAAQLDDRERRRSADQRARREESAAAAPRRTPWPGRRPRRAGRSPSSADSVRLPRIAVLGRAFRQRGLGGAASRGDMGVDRALRRGESRPVRVRAPGRATRRVRAGNRRRRASAAAPAGRFASLALRLRRARRRVGRAAPRSGMSRSAAPFACEGSPTAADAICGAAHRRASARARAFVDARDFVFDAPEAIDDSFENVLEVGQTRLRALVGARLLGAKVGEPVGDIVVVASGGRRQRLQGSARRVEFGDQVGDPAARARSWTKRRGAARRDDRGFRQSGSPARRRRGAGGRRDARSRSASRSATCSTNSGSTFDAGAAIESVVHRASALLPARACRCGGATPLVDARAQIADHRSRFRRRRRASRRDPASG